MAKLFANSGNPDEMQNVASDLGLHCFPFSLLGIFRQK